MPDAEVIERCAGEGPPDGTALLFSALFAMPAEAIANVLAGDPAKAIILVQATAAMGLPAGKVRLGRMLLEGTGVDQDRSAAFRWFWSAAGQGDVEAWNMVGRCFENGWGVAPSYSQAAYWFTQAAEAGDAWAQYNLGHLYLNGQGVPRDAELAVHWYQAASAQGHPRAMNVLGRCHEQGWGTPRDTAAAAIWYRRSADAGYFRGQFNHATMLREAGALDEADHWLSRAAASAPPGSAAAIVAKAAEWERH